jgi:hypothetical protein
VYSAKSMKLTGSDSRTASTPVTDRWEWADELVVFGLKVFWVQESSTDPIPSGPIDLECPHHRIRSWHKLLPPGKSYPSDLALLPR